MNHSVIAFLPRYSGIVIYAPERLQGSLLFLLIDGSAAVNLFFVLSGYILTRRYFASGDTRILLKGAVKRWPRLMGPVLVAVLFSYTLFYFHLYCFQEAGAASGSTWLVQFAGAFRQVGGGPDATPLSIHFKDALLQGSFMVFFRGDWLFDSSLWTMKPELLGSFIAFGAAPILFEAKRTSTYLTLSLVALAIVLTYFARADLAAFPIGVGLAALLPRGAQPLSNRVGLPCLIMAIYLLGYPGSAEGAYQWFAFLANDGTMPPSYPQIVGAAILIAMVELSPAIRRPLSSRLSAFIGELSFPIYLLHALIICSVGSKIYLMYGVIPAIVSVFVVATTASLPLMAFNRRWVAGVNSMAERVMRNRRTHGTAVAAGRPLPGEAHDTPTPRASIAPAS